MRARVSRCPAQRGECGRHCKWERSGDWCAPALKGCPQGARKDISVKVAIFRERMNVEEITHAAVRFTQHDHRVQLLGDRNNLPRGVRCNWHHEA